MVWVELGKRELALKWIETALKKGFSLVKIDRYPGLKELRADERFQRLLQNWNFYQLFAALM